MKVHQLIEALMEFDNELEVHFSYNYGDHWRTTVAPKIRQVELQSVVYSQYHSMPKLIDEEDTRREGATEVLVIS